MRKKRLFIIITILAVLSLSLILVGCKREEAGEVKVTFKAEGSPDIVITVKKGGSLSEIPQVPLKVGNYGRWDVEIFGGIKEDTEVHAIYETEGLKYTVLSDGTYGVSGEYIEPKTEEVYIPNEYNGSPVTEIVENAFYKNQNIRRVVLPNALKIINNKAFFHCTELEELIIPEGVEEICDRALISCYKLNNIKIPEGVRRIGDAAFHASGISASGNTYLKLPDNLISLGKSAFSFCAIETLVMSDKLTEVGASAFENCENLTSVKLSSGLTKISEHMFTYCEKLEQVEIPEGIEEIERESFGGCSALKSVTFPKSLKKIDIAAFGRCISLTSIALPEGVKSIERNVFSMCTSLGNVKLSEGLESIGETAFYKAIFHEIEIPDSVKYLGPGAFLSCYSLKNVKLSANIESIEEGTFAQCSIEKIKIPKKVKYIRDMSFMECSALREVEFEEGSNLESIEGSAFTSTAIKEIVIPKSVREFIKYSEVWPFSGSNRLEKITFEEGSNIKEIIGFDACPRLKVVELPKEGALERIGTKAFQNTLLESIEIPSGVNSIGEEAFKGCKELTRVVFEETEGWSVDGEAISSEELSNPEKAAELLTTKTGEWSRNSGASPAPN